MCEVKKATDVITVTGSTDCPLMYVREYYGWTMSPHYTHKKGEAVCVDVNAEPSPTSKPAWGSSYMAMYPVEDKTYPRWGGAC